MRSLIEKLALLGFAGLGLIQGAMPVSASGPLSRLKPAQGISLEVGTKRAVAYFLPKDGACAVTVVLADSAPDGEPVTQSPARVNMMVGAGTSSRIDTVNGPSLDVACTAGASALHVQTVDRVAYSALQQKR